MARRRAAQVFRGLNFHVPFRRVVFAPFQPSAQPRVGGQPTRQAVAVRVIRLELRHLLGRSERRIKTAGFGVGFPRARNRKEVADGGQHDVGLRSERVNEICVVEPILEERWEALLRVLRPDTFEQPPPRGDEAGGGRDANPVIEHRKIGGVCAAARIARAGHSSRVGLGR